MPLPLLMAGAAGVNMLGNWLGSRSARKAAQAAANVQAGQAEQNAQTAGELPYRLNPYLQQSAEQWGQDVRNAYGQSGADLINEAGLGATDVANSAGRGAEAATRAAYEANAFLDPYMGYGGDAARMMLEQGGYTPTQWQGGYTPTEWKSPEKFTAADLETDPGYQFRLAEGNKALERSAAAKGILQSGGTLKALTKYGQDAASQEYANAWDRAMQGRKQDFTEYLGVNDIGLRSGAQDFNEWQGVNDIGLRSAGLRAQSLGQLAGLGANAAERAGLNMTGAAQYGNTLMTDAARFGAGLRTGARQTAGDWSNEGARYQAGLMHGTTQEALNNIYRGEAARMGYMQDRASALAGGQLGAGQAQANMWANLGNAAGQGLTMAALMNGGGGTTWPNQGRIKGLPDIYAIPGSPNYWPR